LTRSKWLNLLRSRWEYLSPGCFLYGNQNLE
jgi:hypothetical protein